MAKILEAIRDFGPKLKLNKTLTMRDLAAFIAMRTAINETQVLSVLLELKFAILYFIRQGTPINLPGLGRFAPGIGRDGKYRVNIRVDKSLTDGMNEKDAYAGRLDNPDTIGLDNEGFKILWDAEHPNDPLEI
jgi:hypothetical protein